MTAAFAGNADTKGAAVKRNSKRMLKAIYVF
jgi:hypothetical protein